jgi:hypothetical protein
VKRKLEQISIPGEHAVRARTWSVVARAFDEREPSPRPSRWPRLATVAIAMAALGAAALSSPGQAVLDEVREVVGVERAQPALFSLPAPGRLLVSSDAGAWVVQQDGSKRLLGPYREASWSPFGRFVVAARENELVALEPEGGVRWTLARRGVRSPRWTGSETDTRIAYVDRTGIRVVGGDGLGDRLLVRDARGPLAWRPGSEFVLAYTTARQVRVLNATNGRLLWRARRPTGRVTAVEWSADGARVAVLSPHHLRVYDARGRLVDEESPAEGWPDVDVAFRPRTTELAVARVHGSQSSAYVLGGRRLANVTGVVRELDWAPDGRWLVITWQTADQWILARAGGRNYRAVANVSEQFRSHTFPRIEGWCCTR